MDMLPSTLLLIFAIASIASDAKLHLNHGLSVTHIRTPAAALLADTFIPPTGA